MAGRYIISNHLTAPGLTNQSIPRDVIQSLDMRQFDKVATERLYVSFLKSLVRVYKVPQNDLHCDLGRTKAGEGQGQGHEIPQPSVTTLTFITGCSLSS